jgi:hypothetical protein
MMNRQDAKKGGYPEGSGDEFEPSKSWRLGGSFGRLDRNCRRPVDTCQGRLGVPLKTLPNAMPLVR